MQVGVGPGNDTLTVRTINVGLTLLAVQDSGNVGVLDYVPIPVEHAIHPHEAQRLVVGDVVCFSVQLTNPEGETSCKGFYCQYIYVLSEGGKMLFHHGDEHGYVLTVENNFY